MNAERAAHLARAYALERGLECVGPVMDGAQEPERCAFPLYMAPDDYPHGWWVSLAVDLQPGLLTSSRVIGVSKRTGDVRVLGSAGDEG